MIRVHSYESMGTHDGPGLRLVVFVQGCRFNCLYCANPDTISTTGGTDTNIEDIVKMALSQKAFFGKKGGVTVSGGEPTLQAGELAKLFRRLKEEGINTCLDTNGNNMNDEVRQLLEYTDTVLLDIKHIDDDQHRHITGRGNANTLKFAGYLKEKSIRTWLRYVLVPGLSDQPEALKALGEHFKGYDNIERLEILPYHTLGKHKYELLGRKYQLEDTPNNTEEQLEFAHNLLEPYFKYVQVN
ncbi:MAG: pyruvate formate-lyase-activating protein [Bacteroidales bacterium]|nr:pyruvate formate-lyase-activating protein [Bacteroidales bacterium]